MKLVDVEDLYCSDCEYKGCCEDVLCDVKTMPTVDPVHAAGGCYCGECRKAEYDGGYIWCRGNAVKPNDFCSFGQRKEADREI